MAKIVIRNLTKTYSGGAVVTFEGGTQTLRESVAGGLDITGTSADPAIVGAARGSGTKVVGIFSHKLSQSMLVQGDIKSCKDLKVRKIGIQEMGAFSEVLNCSVMFSCGLTQKNVQYVHVSTNGRGALDRRQAVGLRTAGPLN